MTLGPFPHPTRPGLQIGPYRHHTEAERAELVARTLGTGPDPADFWVFAYGSLIWDPCFEPAEQVLVRADGVSRRFCFWTVMSRGSPDRPGLGMGLVESDGHCFGVAQRVSPKTLDTDLEALWDRELLSGVYRPTWIEARPEPGREGRPVRALAFLADLTHPQAVEGLSREEEIEIIATASGRRGPCADYLVRMMDALDRHGVDDPEMRRLCDQVSAFRPGEDAEAPR